MLSDTEIKEKILLALLPDIAFDGWTWRGVESAAIKSGYKKQKAKEIFPNGLSNIIDCFANWVDSEMLEQLKKINSAELRIRDRIKTAVMIRLEILHPHKEAERLALAYWAMPLRTLQAGKILWRSADLIWNWAGDTSTDYNHYTKRALLSGVMSSTMLVWTNDDSDNMDITKKFLERRIENVMQLGHILGKMKKVS